MVFMGSKDRICKELVPIIQRYIDESGAKTYIEFFGGGANVIDKIRCPQRLYYDVNEDLVALLKYAQSDPSLSIAPDDCTKEHYAEVRADIEHKKYSREYRALIGYMASYGGRFFDGGYGRDPSGTRNIYKERVANFRKQNLDGIRFECKDYASFDPDNIRGAVIYLDPPYKDKKGYSAQKMDYEHFYGFCKALAKHNIVLISEYGMPDDFVCIWKKEKKVLQKSNRVQGDVATERLFVVKE